MNWQVFTALSTLQVQIHWMAALASLLFGISIFLNKKGSSLHKAMGRLYVFCMVVTAMSAFFVRSVPTDESWSLFKHFSAIHLLIPFTLFYLAYAIFDIRRGNIKGHKLSMTFTFVGGLLIAGAFTFLPGRHMHTLFFGDPVEIQQNIEKGYKH